MLQQIERWIYQSVGGKLCLERDLPVIARLAVEEVVDWPRTGRQTVEELNNVEKAYLGTKIVIGFKHWLGASNGKIFAVDIDGIEVGIKHVFNARCYISRARIGRPLIVIQTDLSNSRVSLAILVAHSSQIRLKARPNSLSRDAEHSRLILRWLCTNCEIRKSAVFTQMVVMYRKLNEQQRQQMRDLVDGDNKLPSSALPN